MVPVRADFGSEYSKAPVSSAGTAPSAPRLVLCDVSQPASSPLRARRARSHRQRSLLSLAVVCAVLFLIASCVSSLWQSAVAAYAASQHTTPTIAVRVHKGDTLWRYAARYGDPNAYMPDRVQALAQENHLPPSAPLAPGQTLCIPVQNPIELAHLNRVSSSSRIASRVVR